MENLILHIEALVFASENGISPDEIQSLLEAVTGMPQDRNHILALLDEIKDKYDCDDFAIGLFKLNGGYQFLTKKVFHAVINQLQMQRAKKKLSRSSLETLAIIAYKQPVTKSDVEQIRGVNCDYTIQRLLEKGLIVITGKADSAGKPIIYGTSQLFMDYFGIDSMADLPQLKEVNEIGESHE